ncbi:TetR/AcrR family transcriptional regulator [Marinobacterium rhizophilum]|uniref:TetR/AcrR family transcriptional regulator n=1 Tax=Marinobacterium rhizophilum TaxID=420402 RepID=A0ABY5HMB9_9GAMM|nr:TetR/AcrR family transcriptional regulator [Marinobacterium rhizophilum]UTW12407.1 TetR/AcrR family transcriptional regulator [Marinobacterium rhizophilum]
MASLKTKDTLLITAERMFAESGIEGVSLRQIAVEAKQKNTSALHYHFGSKEDLIEAIFDYRMPMVNECRLHYLAQLETDGRNHNLQALVQALVYPLAGQLDHPEGSPNYLGFMENLIRASTIEQKRRFYTKYDQSLSQVARLIRETLPEIPRDLINLRLALVVENMIQSLSEWRRLVKEHGQSKAIYRLENYKANLVAMLAGSLSAPAPASLQQDENAAKAMS